LGLGVRGTTAGCDGGTTVGCASRLRLTAVPPVRRPEGRGKCHGGGDVVAAPSLSDQQPI